MLHTAFRKIVNAYHLKAILLPFALATGLAGTSQTLLFEEFTSTSLPTGWTVAGSDGNWVTSTSNCLPSGNRTMQTTGWSTYYPINPWAFTPGLSLTAGITYVLSFKQCMVQSGSAKTESLKITVGNQATIAAQTQTLLDLPTLTNTTSIERSTTFTPTVSGTYHFAFHCYSGYSGVANSYRFLSVDDVKIFIPDLAPPTIAFTPLANACATSARTLTATITDVSGVPTTGTGRPALYWSVNSGSWNTVTGTHTSGSTYSFTFGGGVSGGDVVRYYIVAQDGVATPNVGASPASGAAGFSATPPRASTPPTSPASYTVLVPPTASAGPDRTICVEGTTTGLGGNTPTGPATGSWSITGGGTGTFDDANLPNATFAHTGGSGPITLRWTVSNPPCEAAFDEIVINVNPATGDTDGDGIPDCADNCPELAGEEGGTCYAGPLFASGVIIDCECIGQDPVSCNNDLTLEFQTDGNPGQTTWELVEQGTGFVVRQGGPLNPEFGVETNFTCLPDGCFYLRVRDEAGDGMTSGGYILRTSSDDQRIIDNRNNFSTGSASQLSGGQGFCLPLGSTRVIHSSRDKLDWVAGKFIVVAEDPAVSAQYGVANATSGYEFWFFDPNGSYSFRRFRSHATSDGYGTGALRANHFKINGWINTGTTPWIPSNILLNVRVRGRVAGNNLPFGPAFLFKIDAALAACPHVKLQDDPANTADYSCGVTRSFGGTNSATNRITANPPQPIPVVASANVRYQFRFRIPGESICIVRPPQTSARLQLNWNAASGTLLQCGKTYDVDVRVSLDGGATWCFGPANTNTTAACGDSEDWGKVCKLTISGCAQATGSSSNMVVNSNGTLTLYPNPNRGDQLFVDLSSVEAGVSTVSVDIFDLTGKKVTARMIAVQDGFVKTALELNGEIANGVYLVNITAGSKAYTERLMIQK